MWWHIHTIRKRQFGRKLIQSICDSRRLSNKNQSNVEIVERDLFFMQGDYLLIECENTSQSNCYFLIYYIYKSKSIKNDRICQRNNFSNLFKFVI